MPDSLALVGIVGLSIGIIVLSLAALPAPFILFIGGTGVLFLGAWFFGKRDAYAFIAVFLLAFSLGALRTAVVPTALPASYASQLDASVELSGTVVADPDVRETNERITIAIGQGASRTKILAVADRFTDVAYGDEVTVSGTLTEPQPFDTDGGRTFAYDRYLAASGIMALIPRAHLERTGVSRAPLAAVMRFLYGAKHAFVSGLETALPEPHASLAEGLLAGGKQGLGSDLLDAFTAAGLLPVVVLSGYNVMIVAEAILVALSFLPKRFALAVAGGTVILFVIAAGGGASALRALLMAGLALFARATGRRYDALRALIAAFVAMLFITPLSLVYDPGLAFSFLATLGLIILSPLIEVRLSWIGSAILRDVLATTIAAQLFVLPLLLYETGNLSFVAVLANALVLPIVPLTMLLSFIAGGVGLLVPAIAPFIGLPAYALLAYIIGIAEGLAAFPFAHVVVPSFPFVLVLVLYAALGRWMLRMKKAARA